MEYVWVLEDEEERADGAIDNTMLYLASTLEKAEAYMRNGKGAPKLRGGYLIYPQPIDEDWITDLPEFAHLEHSPLYFYDHQGNQIENRKWLSFLKKRSWWNRFELSCGWQWPPQFGYYNAFYDGTHRVLHLGVFWVELFS